MKYSSGLTDERMKSRFRVHIGCVQIAINKGEKMDLPLIVKNICEMFESNGCYAYIVGGAVRDDILGLEPKDFDMEVYGVTIPTIINMLEGMDLEVDIVGKSFEVIKVKGQDIDISIPRRDSKVAPGHKGFKVEGDPSMTPREAARRRDFTMNSIAWDPMDCCYVDPFNGIDDLNNRLLKHTSAAFSEDPLRVLRGMQFMARFDLDADPSTIELCSKISMDELSRERVYDEWVKMILKGKVISKGLQFLVDTGWISNFPELEALVDLEQEPEWHPEGDAFIHTSLCMDAYAEHHRVGIEWDDLVVGFAVLCHDLGKATTTKKIDGRIKSTMHEVEGKKPTISFLSRMIESDNQKKSSPLIDAVVPLVLNHMAPTMFYDQKSSNGAIRRLAARVGRIDWLLKVSRSDKMGRGSHEYEPWAEVWLAKMADDINALDSKPKRILMGRHLIDRGYEPGFAFKDILDESYERQLDGEFSDEEGAIEWLKTMEK